jgi:hypothetical protein
MSLLYPKTPLLSNHLPVSSFCVIIRRPRDGRTNLSLYTVNWRQATGIPILGESVLLKQVKYIYDPIPFRALALKPHCETSSSALVILEIVPSGSPISSLLGEGLRPLGEVSDRAPSGGGRETLPNRRLILSSLPGSETKKWRNNDVN